MRLIITGVASTRTLPLPMLGAVCSSLTTRVALPRSPVTTLPSSMRSMVTVQCGPMRSLVFGLLMACASLVNAAWPTKPVTFFVPSPPADVTAPIVRQPLSKQLGQPIVIENHGGAGGSLGTAVAARATPDGYTLLFTLSSHSINPAIYAQLPFDTRSECRPISIVCSLPHLFAVNNATPYKTFEEVVQYMKKNPGKLDYGSVGIGSPSHIAGELLKLRLNTQTVALPL